MYWTLRLCKRSTCVHEQIKLHRNFPDVASFSHSVYITRHLRCDRTKRSPIPIAKYRERRQHWVLCVDANGLIWMLNVLQPPCSLLQCISSLRVYDPSLSASNVQKHLLLFFMSKTVMWILKYIFTNEKKNPSRLFLKNELGEGDAALNLTSLFWFGVGFFCFVFCFPPSLMKFLKMRWAVVAIET